MRVHPYINFAGNCAEAFRFYEALLGAKITFSMTHADTPGATPTPEWKDKIMHATLQIGDTVMHGMDAAHGHYQTPGGMWVSLEMDDAANAERVWAGLTEGGFVVMPLQETFWAKRFGMVKDRFGVPWMINCAKPM